MRTVPSSRTYSHGRLFQLSGQVCPSNAYSLNVLDVESTGGNAVIALIFAEYMNRLFFHTTKAEVSPDDIPQWAIKLTAAAAVLVVSVICVATPNLGPRTAVVFTTVKVRRPAQHVCRVT